MWCIESVAGLVEGARDLADSLNEGWDKAVSDAQKGFTDAAKSVANGASVDGRDVSLGRSRGASDLSAGMQQGALLDGLAYAGADVLYGCGAGVGDFWNGVINGGSALLGGINQGAHDMGAEVQRGYEAGVNDVAAGVGKTAGPGAARAFRIAAMAGEGPVKQQAQFDWGVTEGAVTEVGNIVTGLGSLYGNEFRFDTDPVFRGVVINKVGNGAIGAIQGASYAGLHPLDAAAQTGATVWNFAKNFAMGIYQGGVEANNRGALAEYVGQGVGRVGVVAATTVVVPAGDLGPAADMTAESFALVDEGASALGYEDASGLVDNVFYNWPGSPYGKWPLGAFGVSDTGERTIAIDAATFRLMKADRLLVAAHELVHAEQWMETLRQFGGDVTAALKAFRVERSSPTFVKDELAAHERSLKSVEQYLGGVGPQLASRTTQRIKQLQNQIERMQKVADRR